MTEHTAIEGVFFDLDGTLMDTANDFIVVVNQLLKEHGLPPADSDLIRSNVSAGSKTLVSIALKITPDHPDIEQKRQQLLRLYADHINNYQRTSPAALYPGMPALIHALEQRNIRWGVVTNKPEAYTRPLLQQARLDTRSSATICPDHVSKPKPDPQALLLACQHANCAPKKSIYIGDHKRDIEAGKRAGMVTVAALYGYITDNDTPYDWGADFQASNAQDIHQWLERHNWKIKKTLNPQPVSHS